MGRGRISTGPEAHLSGAGGRSRWGRRPNSTSQASSSTTVSATQAGLSSPSISIVKPIVSW